jgi:hypothetical protein
MGALRKAAISLIIAGSLLSLFAVLSWLGLFDRVETEFYAPAQRREVLRKLNGESALIARFLDARRAEFSAALEDQAVRRSFNIQQNQADVFERSRVIGELMTTAPALQWVRFVDLPGNRIHFSTESADLVIRSGTTTAYRAWTEVPRFIRITPLMAEGQGGVLFDGENARIVFYLPFYDATGIKQGIALFSIAARALADELFAGGWTAITESVTLINEPKGVICGLRGDIDGALREHVAAVWREEGSSKRGIIQSVQRRFVLFSQEAAKDLFVGLLIDETVFSLPPALRVLMLLLFGVTVYILLFWCLSITQDPTAVVQLRMKRLMVNILQEYFSLKDDMDWGYWKRELIRRREDARRELLRDISEKKNAGIYRYVNSFFDRSWDDLVSVISSRSRGDVERLDEAKMEDILTRILGATMTLAGKTAARTAQNAAAARSPPSPSVLLSDAAARRPLEKPGGGAELEELEELEELDGTGVIESGGGEERAHDDVDELEELDADDERIAFGGHTVQTPPPEAAAEKAEQDGGGAVPVAQISEAIRSEIAREAKREREERARREQEEAAQRERAAAAKPERAEEPAADAASLLETDPFQGIASEEGEASLHSDDFSYGRFVTEIPEETARGSEPLPAAAGTFPAGELHAPAIAPVIPPVVPKPRPAAPPAAVDEEELEELEELDELDAFDDADYAEESAPPLEPEGAFEDVDGLLPPDEDSFSTVETFAEVSAGELEPPAPASGESPGHGTDINKMAMRIEFEPECDHGWDHDFELDMVVASPMDELFSSVLDEEVIGEHEGVPYINESSLGKKNNGKKELDPEIKTLVDSVLTPSRPHAKR